MNPVFAALNTGACSTNASRILRPRLTGRCLDERIVVVEAAGGYGKSELADRPLADRAFEFVSVQLELDPLLKKPMRSRIAPPPR